MVPKDLLYDYHGTKGVCHKYKPLKRTLINSKKLHKPYLKDCN